jgi:hypothetical protein
VAARSSVSGSRRDISGRIARGVAVARGEILVAVQVAEEELGRRAHARVGQEVVEGAGQARDCHCRSSDSCGSRLRGSRTGRAPRAARPGAAPAAARNSWLIVAP